MKKTNRKKPLTLETSTVRTLRREALDQIAAGYNYNGSDNIGCYMSGATLCPLCYAR